MTCWKGSIPPPFLLLLVVTSFVLHPSSFLHEDQVGIDKVRLLEVQAGEYVLEVDTHSQFAAAFRDPVLPERFQLTNFQRDRQRGYLILRYRFQSAAEPLDQEDELLLPWGRSGASITAQWIDGSVHQNLFLRDFEGIRVPIRMLKPSQPSTSQLVWRSLLLGVTHARTGWNHWILVAAVALLACGWWRVGLLLFFMAGQALSLVVTDVGLLVVPSEASEVCVVVVALLVARAASLDTSACQRFAPVMLMLVLVLMLVLGLVHGVANARVLLQTAVREAEVVQALFAYNLGIDTWQFAAAALMAVFAAMANRITARGGFNRIASVGVGGVAFGMLLIALTGTRLSPEHGLESDRDSGPFELPGAQIVSPGMGGPQPPRALQDPVATFLTIEPIETRLEVLMRLANAREWLALPADTVTIGIAQQENTNQQLIDRIASHSSLRIDGSDMEPGLKRADFVTVEPNGIFSRPTQVQESIDEAVIGVTFVYDTAQMADSVTFEWKGFSPEVQLVPATTTDPFGSRKHELSIDQPKLVWTNRWRGYRLPEIRPVAVSQPGFPLLSVLLAAIAARKLGITEPNYNAPEALDDGVDS